MNVPVIAGTVSTVLFAASMLPMLIKASRTKDLASYSIGNIVITNVANVVHSIYVFDLPAGPVWLLHTFYVVASALMLVWCLRYRHDRKPASHRVGEMNAEPRRAGTSMPIPSLNA